MSTVLQVQPKQSADSEVPTLALCDVSANRQKLARQERHWSMLILATVVVLASCCLTVTSGDRVALAGWVSRPLPHLCAMHAFLGKECPGCGLTRSFVYLAHGDWQSAWQMHRLGWLLFAAVLLQFPYRIAGLARPDHDVLGVIAPKIFGYALIGLLVANWFAGMVIGSGLNGGF